MNAQLPNSAFLCDMWGRRCGRPAVVIVDAKVRISPRDMEPLAWLCCDSLVCLLAATAHAEMIGEHVDSRPLTLVEAEELTGLVAVAQA
jgi:hypothetical protein